jgi:hypothetical protein
MVGYTFRVKWQQRTETSGGITLHHACHTRTEELQSSRYPHPDVVISRNYSKYHLVVQMLAVSGLHLHLHANETEDGTPENAELVHPDSVVDYTTRIPSLDEVVGPT